MVVFVYVFKKQLFFARARVRARAVRSNKEGHPT
jgi:hypothetical protein